MSSGVDNVAAAAATAASSQRRSVDDGSLGGHQLQSRAGHTINVLTL